uniref:hypothetical protein n=1 Tax=Pararhizobium sp. IMCC3301 TaxID=3067904 RepID=UPI002741583D|nr:hypothetical protein [Pararhizobium sp. IMCC3301]
MAVLSFPLMLVPLVVYNLFAFDLLANYMSARWDAVLFSPTMISGAVFAFTLSDLFIVSALLLLCIEVLKATRIGNLSIVDHMLSMVVFIAFLVEFLLVREAATTLFFILMVITLIDVVAGFAISIRSATRDVAVGGY